MELINNWVTKFTEAHKSMSDLFAELSTETDELTSAITAWDSAKGENLSMATESFLDLPENLNEFIRDVFTKPLLAVYAWCASHSTSETETANKGSARKKVQKTQLLLKQMCEYFLAHEYNALVGSFRNDQDNVPVDFFFRQMENRMIFKGLNRGSQNQDSPRFI